MKRGKKFFALLLVFMLSVSLLAGCAGDDTSEETPNDDVAKPVVFKLGHAVNEDHPYHLGAVKFKEMVEEGTDGNVIIELFPNNQLGTGERDLVEGMQIGTVDIVVSSTGPLSGFEKKFMLFDFPFLFRDKQHANKVLDGEIGNYVLSLLEPQGIKGLAWYENGFRHLTNSKKEVSVPEDAKGLKIRTMENKVHMAIWEALGALPTPMAWGEIFTALQQGTVHGQENPIPIIYTQKVYEVQEYLSLTGHVYSPAIIMMSKDKFEALSDEYKEIFMDAALESGALERAKITEMEEGQLALLEEKGMTITYPDKALFLEKTKPVYDQFKAELGEDAKYIDEILNMK